MTLSERVKAKLVKVLNEYGGMTSESHLVNELSEFKSHVVRMVLAQMLEDDELQFYYEEMLVPNEKSKLVKNYYLL